MAVVSSCRKTAGDKPEEGEDDVKSSCPLCPGRHTCYNGPGQGSRSREGELTPKPVLSSDCRLQLACMKPESLVIAGQPYGGEFVPGLVHTARHTMGAGHARSRYLNRKEGDAEGRASDWSEVVTMVAVLEGAAGSPPFQGELMLVGYFGLTLLHTQKEASCV
ncbi:hypothetical protein O6P43_035321 [Quillaja saponaria]|uniref:Uncharacterized protein n=1 Tax=Quillaja saponaria TaxID=32244 RepID=A0AAD7KLJ7_QUISA|nr:hypothetical protein O6P43_035321 [Quillaja saponaria]